MMTTIMTMMIMVTTILLMIIMKMMMTTEMTRKLISMMKLMKNRKELFFIPAMVQSFRTFVEHLHRWETAQTFRTTSFLLIPAV